MQVADSMFFLYNVQLHNVALAIDLMRDSGMKFYAKPEGKEIVSTMLQLPRICDKLNSYNQGIYYLR